MSPSRASGSYNARKCHGNLCLCSCLASTPKSATSPDSAASILDGKEPGLSVGFLLADYDGVARDSATLAAAPFNV